MLVADRYDGKHLHEDSAHLPPYWRRRLLCEVIEGMGLSVSPPQFVPRCAAYSLCDPRQTSLLSAAVPLFIKRDDNSAHLIRLL